MLLEAVASARDANAAVDDRRGHRVRHRIEHIELCLPKDIQRFVELEVIPSMQPFHERPPSRPLSLWFQKVPENEWETAFPWASLVETGAPLVFGSDWPIVSCDCLAAMRHAIARQPWREGLKNQGLGFADAAAGFCSNPAYAVNEENVAGRIEPGMVADLVILSGDIGPDGSQLTEDTKAVLTLCDGEIVYERK
jgi:predicted amidohydrolase YtcJ